MQEKIKMKNQGRKHILGSSILCAKGYGYYIYAYSNFTHGSQEKYQNFF